MNRILKLNTASGEPSKPSVGPSPLESSWVRSPERKEAFYIGQVWAYGTDLLLGAFGMAKDQGNRSNVVEASASASGKGTCFKGVTLLRRLSILRCEN